MKDFNSESVKLPRLAITDSFLIVNILSTLITYLTLRLFTLFDSNIISLGEIFSDMTELIAETIKSSYLSFVIEITTAGLTFILLRPENGNGISIISPVFTSYLVINNPDKYFLFHYAKMKKHLLGTKNF